MPQTTLTNSCTLKASSNKEMKNEQIEKNEALLIDYKNPCRSLLANAFAASPRSLAELVGLEPLLSAALLNKKNSLLSDMFNLNALGLSPHLAPIAADYGGVAAAANISSYMLQQQQQQHALLQPPLQNHLRANFIPPLPLPLRAGAYINPTSLNIMNGLNGGGGGGGGGGGSNNNLQHSNENHHHLHYHHHNSNHTQTSAACINESGSARKSISPDAAVTATNSLNVAKEKVSANDRDDTDSAACSNFYHDMKYADEQRAKESKRKELYDAEFDTV
jgi:K+-transporting ATPase c subunit